MMYNVNIKKGVVYALYSPVTYKIRSIGQTTRPVKTRLTEHVSHARNGRFVNEKECAWVQALAREGLRPGIIILEEVADEKELDAKEQHWIALGLSLGWSLLNENAGGKGKPKLKEGSQAR